MLFNRVCHPATRWTFAMSPVRELLNRYVDIGGAGWLDPFCGLHSPAQIKNDHNPANPADYHMDAMDFVQLMQGKLFNGILFDPPYSYRQVTECYKIVGVNATREDTSTSFYNRVLDPASNIIKQGGYAISCGWNSNGFGKARGFEIIEILLVAHGGHRHDTIIVVDEKVHASKYTGIPVPANHRLITPSLFD